MNHYDTASASGGNLGTLIAAERASPEPFMEHRWGSRRPCRAHVCVSAGGGIAGTGRLRNVSTSGAFLETALPLPLFGQVAVAILRDDGAVHTIEFTATVVRREADGYGIEWTDATAGPICRTLGCTIDCTAPCTSPRR